MKILGHRGQRKTEGPYENTKEAITEAMEKGLDGVEIDVITSKDNKCFIIHDEEIEKHSIYDSGNITELTAEEVEQKRIGKNSPYKIPRLEEILRLFKEKYSKAILNIEIKEKGIAKEVAEQVNKSGIDNERVIISSFNHPDLYEYRKYDKKAKIGILFAKEAGEEYKRYLSKTAKDLSPSALHPNVENEMLAALEGEKNIWTVKPEDKEKLKNLHDVNIMVDDPAYGPILKTGLEQKK